MTDNQKRDAVQFLVGWLDKMSVGCFIVGLFETEHIFGGTIGGTILFLAGLSVKVRSAK